MDAIIHKFPHCFQEEQRMAGVAVNENGPPVVASSSFYTAMRILPRSRREAMYAVYAFCRAMDEGGRPGGCPPVLPPSPPPPPVLLPPPPPPRFPPPPLPSRRPLAEH